MDTMGYIIEYWFFGAGAAHGSKHFLNKLSNLFSCAPVMGFITYFKGNKVGFIFICHPGIWINVVQELGKIIFLGFNGIRICKAVVFSIFIGKPRSLLIGFRPTIAPIRNRSDHKIYIPVLELLQ